MKLICKKKKNNSINIFALILHVLKRHIHAYVNNLYNNENRKIKFANNFLFM